MADEPAAAEQDEAVTASDEEVKLAAWRIEVLIRWGCDVYWAGRFAAFDNWRDVEKLLANGCSQPLIERIL